MKLLYELGYRSLGVRLDMGPAEELVNLLGSGRISPCRAIDLGCGTGRNAIFLAQNGFEVVGVDFVSSAIAEAKRRAEKAKVNVHFVVDDLANLRWVKGTFDFLVDYGTLDVFHFKKRDKYVRTVVSLTHTGSKFFLCGWEWPLNWWEKLLLRRLSLFGAILEPGEVEQRLGKYFEIERISYETNPRHGPPAYMSGKQKPPGYAVYLMARK